MVESDDLGGSSTVWQGQRSTQNRRGTGRSVSRRGTSDPGGKGFCELSVHPRVRTEGTAVAVVRIEAVTGFAVSF